MAYFINNKNGIHISEKKKNLFVSRREGFSVVWKISVEEEIKGRGRLT